VGLALLATAGCGRSDEEQAAALCAESAWDPAPSAEEDIDAYSEVWRTLDSDGTVDLKGMAQDACPGYFDEYELTTEQQLAELREQYGQHDPSRSAAGADTSIADFLAAPGVSESMVRQLGAVAVRTDYRLSPGTPLPFEQAQNSRPSPSASATTWRAARRPGRTRKSFQNEGRCR
jgi:hypothetical protein